MEVSPSHEWREAYKWGMRVWVQGNWALVQAQGAAEPLPGSKAICGTGVSVRQWLTWEPSGEPGLSLGSGKPGVVLDKRNQEKKTQQRKRC